MDRPGIRQVPEGSGEERKKEETGCAVICGAPTTRALKGWVKVETVKANRYLHYLPHPYPIPLPSVPTCIHEDATVAMISVLQTELLTKSDASNETRTATENTRLSPQKGHSFPHLSCPSLLLKWSICLLFPDRSGNKVYIPPLGLCAVSYTHLTLPTRRTV